ncbi:MAG: glycosyltransferase [Opitutales bacterium]
MTRIVVACGGTGGHLSPGIALAEALQRGGHKPLLVISRKEVDSRLVQKYGELDFFRVPGTYFSWKPWQMLRFVFSQLRSIFVSGRMLRREDARCVVAFGGFASLGTVVSGFLLGLPVVLHEANRRPGRAVRLLSGLAKRVYLPKGVRLRGLPPRTVRHLGYPVRSEIKRLPRDGARERLGFPHQGKLLLVLGGSQGAQPLNEWVKRHFESLAQEGIHILCVSGPRQTGGGALEYRRVDGLLVRARFLPFCDQMADVYACADLVVSRAGAGTIAELCRVRLPSILVPYPFAADNHQQENARFLEQQGGAVVLAQTHLDRLLAEVGDLIFNDWMLQRMRHNLATLDVEDCVEQMLADLEQLLRQEEPPAQTADPKLSHA